MGAVTIAEVTQMQHLKLPVRDNGLSFPRRHDAGRGTRPLLWGGAHPDLLQPAVVSHSGCGAQGRHHGSEGLPVAIVMSKAGG